MLLYFTEFECKDTFIVKEKASPWQLSSIHQKKGIRNILAIKMANT